MGIINILTGAVDSGKTSFLEQLLRQSPEANKIGGIYTPKSIREGKFLGYDMVDIDSCERFPFIRMEPQPGWERWRKYYFSAEAFDKANGIIESSFGKEILIIDEIGYWELQGKGLSRGLISALNNFNGKMILVVREWLLKEVVNLVSSHGSQIVIFPHDRWKAGGLIL